MGRELTEEVGLDKLRIEEDEVEEIIVENLDSNKLIECARYGEVAILQELFNQGLVDRFDAVDDRGNTMLHMFAANGHLDCIRFLMQHSKNPSALLDYANDEGNTALHWACVAGQLAACQLLVLNGSQYTFENKMGRTPICEALKHGRKDILTFFEEFLGKKADQNNAEKSALVDNQKVCERAPLDVEE